MAQAVRSGWCWSGGSGLGCADWRTPGRVLDEARSNTTAFIFPALQRPAQACVCRPLRCLHTLLAPPLDKLRTPSQNCE